MEPTPAHTHLCAHKECTHRNSDGSHITFSSARGVQYHKKNTHQHPCPPKCSRCVHWKDKCTKLKKKKAQCIPCQHEGCPQCLGSVKARWEHEKKVGVAAVSLTVFVLTCLAGSPQMPTGLWALQSAGQSSTGTDTRGGREIRVVSRA